MGKDGKEVGKAMVVEENRSSPASKSFRSMGKKVRVLGGGCNVVLGGVVCDPYS